MLHPIFVHSLFKILVYHENYDAAKSNASLLLTDKSTKAEDKKNRCLLFVCQLVHLLVNFDLITMVSSPGYFDLVTMVSPCPCFLIWKDYCGSRNKSPGFVTV